MSTDRPLGVRLIALLLGINGFVSIIAGILLLFHVGEEAAIDALGVTEANLSVLAITAIAVGVITMVIAAALRSGSNFARLLLVLLWVGQLGVLVYSMVSLHSVHWTSAMWPTVITGLAGAYLLLDKDAREFFSSVKS